MAENVLPKAISDRCHDLALVAPLLPSSLETRRLRLQPLTLDSMQGLREKIRNEPGLFRYLDLDASRNEAIDGWFIRVIKDTMNLDSLHFIIRTKESDVVIGHTSVVGIKRSIARCEIAWTWLFAEYQGQGYARESKFALYEFLFREGFVRVQLVADNRNEASLRSIAASGARLEGVLRKNRRARDGSWQDSALFSLIDADWTSFAAGVV